MNILFTCGGTAGHINPAVALARLFQERNPGCRILFVGADGGMETRLVPKEGYDIRTVTITNFQRSLTPAAVGHNLKTLFNMNRSRKQADAILDDFKPDLVVGTGGYASYPVVNAAAKRKIPTAVHESNAVPGLTTKALSKVVDVVMVGFEESRSHYNNPEKVVVTGTPVRGDFFRYTRKEAREKLGIADDRPLLLSFFGSLGAAVMNDHMTAILSRECEAGQRPQGHRRGAAGVHLRHAPYHGGRRPGGLPCRRLHHLGADRHCQACGAGAVPQRGGRPPDQERQGALRTGRGPAGERAGVRRQDRRPLQYHLRSSEPS